LKNGDNIVGKVTNNAASEQSITVVVVFRNEDNEVIGGDLCFFDYLPSGGTKPFSYSTGYKDIYTDNFECFAYVD
jgi:hypothetical protein